MSRILSAVCLFVVIASPGRPAFAQQAAPAASSLYERLGGAYPVAVVVDAFIERLLVNPTLNANPAIDSARTTVPKQGLKFHVTTLVCEATGGPCRYTGRSMKEAHKHLSITETAWKVMLVDFKATLDAFNVPVEEQRELFAIVESTKPEIVVAGR